LLNGKYILIFPSEDADDCYDDRFGKEYLRLEGKFKKFTLDVQFR
jgi:hypothetical protein